MVRTREELLDDISQYFTIKSIDKDRVYNLYIADQVVGILILVVKGDKIKFGDAFEYLVNKYGFTALFEANFNYEGKDHTIYLVSGGKDELKKKAKQFYDYCLLNRASNSYLYDCEG
jgi:hypothetical protein